jgi:hypothetical protein
VIRSHDHEGNDSRRKHAREWSRPFAYSRFVNLPQSRISGGSSVHYQGVFVDGFPVAYTVIGGMIMEIQ